MGDRDRIICNFQQKQFVNERSCCSYRTHIQRVIKKGEAPHYIIVGNCNFERNDDCRLHEYHGNTTVRRRILAKLKVVNNLAGNAKGAHVANAVKIDAGIGVSKIYTKGALRDATGHAKAFREAFTKIDCLINYLSTIPHPADCLLYTSPSPRDATLSRMPSSA